MSSAAPRRDPKRGTWTIIVELTPGPDGRRRQAKRRGFPTKKAAQAELDRLRTTVTERAYVAPVRQTVAAFLLDDWLPAVRGSLQPSTHASYARTLRNHVLPHVGGIQLRQLDPAHLNKMYATLGADGGRSDGQAGGLSPRSIRYAHTIVGKALSDAVKWGRIVRSPATLAEPPRPADAKAREMKTWTAPQLGKFLAGERDHRDYSAWLFLASTGCRRGEALGLRWSDVELDGASCAIRQTVTAIDHEIHVAQRTKTGRSRRIDLDAGTVAALRAWRKVQAAERLALGAGYEDLDLVFADVTGAPTHPELFSRRFERHVRRSELPLIRLHDLRHGWATMALEAGVHPKVVSERLGHSSVGITLDLYSHASAPMLSDAAERVAGLFLSGS